MFRQKKSATCGGGPLGGPPANSGLRVLCVQDSEPGLQVHCQQQVQSETTIASSDLGITRVNTQTETSSSITT